MGASENKSNGRIEVKIDADCSEIEFNDSLERFKILIEDTGNKIVIKSDMRGAQRPNAAQRSFMNKFFRDLRPQFNAKIKAWAILVETPTEKGIITALQWFNKFRFPVRVFRDDAKAEEFLSRHS